MKIWREAIPDEIVMHGIGYVSYSKGRTPDPFVNNPTVPFLLINRTAYNEVSRVPPPVLVAHLNYLDVPCWARWCSLQWKLIFRRVIISGRLWYLLTDVDDKRKMLQRRVSRSHLITYMIKCYYHHVRPIKTTYARSDASVEELNGRGGVENYHCGFEVARPVGTGRSLRAG